MRIKGKVGEKEYVIASPKSEKIKTITYLDYWFYVGEYWLGYLDVYAVPILPGFDEDELIRKTVETIEEKTAEEGTTLLFINVYRTTIVNAFGYDVVNKYTFEVAMHGSPITWAVVLRILEIVASVIVALIAAYVVHTFVSAAEKPAFWIGMGLVTAGIIGAAVLVSKLKR